MITCKLPRREKTKVDVYVLCPQPSHTCFPRLTIHSSIPTQVPSYPVLMTFASDSVFKAAQKTVSRFPTPDTRLHILIRARRGEGVTPDVKRCTSIAVLEGICCKMQSLTSKLQTAPQPAIKWVMTAKICVFLSSAVHPK